MHGTREQLASAGHACTKGRPKTPTKQKQQGTVYMCVAGAGRLYVAHVVLIVCLINLTPFWFRRDTRQSRQSLADSVASVDKLERALRDAGELLAGFKLQNESLTHQVKDLESQAAEQQATITKLEATLGGAEAVSSQHNVSSTRASITFDLQGANTELAKNRLEITTLKQQNAELQDALATAKNKLGNSNSTHEENAAKLGKMAREQQNAIATLQSTVTQAEGTPSLRCIASTPHFTCSSFRSKVCFHISHTVTYGE